MSSRVREIMNSELFRVRPGDVSSDVLNGIRPRGARLSKCCAPERDTSTSGRV